MQPVEVRPKECRYILVAARDVGRVTAPPKPRGQRSTMGASRACGPQRE
jgi:hypothetical protein